MTDNKQEFWLEKPHGFWFGVWQRVVAAFVFLFIIAVAFGMYQCTVYMIELEQRM